MTASSGEARLVVCTSCRDDSDRADGRATGRAGERLFNRICASGQMPITVAPHTCLSACKRSCAFALQGPGRWTYVFGDCGDDVQSLDDIAACVSLYIGNKEGFLERRKRPFRLRDGILSRVPPLVKGASADMP